MDGRWFHAATMFRRLPKLGLFRCTRTYIGKVGHGSTLLNMAGDRLELAPAERKGEVISDGAFAIR